MDKLVEITGNQKELLDYSMIIQQMIFNENNHNAHQAPIYI